MGLFSDGQPEIAVHPLMVDNLALRQLRRFLGLALHSIPTLFWVAIGCLTLAVLLKEEWANVPWLGFFFLILEISSALILPWLAALTCWRIADALPLGLWQLLWRLMAIALLGGSALLSILVGLFLIGSETGLIEP